MYILHLHYQSQGYANNEIGTKRQINVLSFDDKALPKDYDDKLTLRSISWVLLLQ